MKRRTLSFRYPKRIYKDCRVVYKNDIDRIKIVDLEIRDIYNECKSEADWIVLMNQNALNASIPYTIVGYYEYKEFIVSASVDRKNIIPDKIEEKELNGN